MVLLGMATRETKTDTQPGEKEIEQIEKDRPTVEEVEEIIKLEYREHIRQALLLHLGATKYTIISYTDGKEVQTDKNNRKSKLTLVKDESKEVVPDPFYKNEHMTYNTEPRRPYTIWDCLENDDSDRRFLYGWSQEGRVYVIAPYSVPPVEENSDVMCSYRLEVTKAMHSKHPIKALKNKLKQLANRSNSQKGFNKDMYHWDTKGTDDGFTIRKPGTEIEKKKTKILHYWKAEKEGIKRNGKMVLTTLEAETAQMKFLET